MSIKENVHMRNQQSGKRMGKGGGAAIQEGEDFGF